MSSRKTQKPRSSRSKKSSQPRSTVKLYRAPSTKSRSTGMGGMSTSKLAMAICSKVNPFCKESIGSKQGDESSGFSQTFQVRDFISATTDANGDAIFSFYPTPDANLIYASTIVAHAGTVYTSQNSSSYSFINANFSELRVVSWGVRLLTTQAWTSATGTVSTFLINNPLTSSNTVNVTSLQNGQDAAIFALRDLDVTFIGKPIDHTWTEYQPISTTGGIEGNNNNNWTCPLFCVTGATASTTYGTFEVVINLELRNNPGSNSSLLNQFATAPVTPNPSLTDLSTMTRHYLPNFIDSSFAKSVEKIVYNAAVGAVRDASPTLVRPAFGALMMA